MESQIISVKLSLQERLFFGFGFSEIFYSGESGRWEIHNLLLEETLVAVKNGSSQYPFGTHRWQFTNNVCNDGDDRDYRSLNLHARVEETGKFCCETGLCIDSGVVCDDVENCAGGEDEHDCNLIHFIDQKYRRDKPPVEVVSTNKTKVLLPLRINCSLTVLDLGKV